MNPFPVVAKAATGILIKVTPTTPEELKTLINRLHAAFKTFSAYPIVPQKHYEKTAEFFKGYKLGFDERQNSINEQRKIVVELRYKILKQQETIESLRETIACQKK